VILVGIYVDDLLVTSNNAKLIDELFEQMKAFDVKDLGEAEKFRDIKIESKKSLGYIMSKDDDGHYCRSIWSEKCKAGWNTDSRSHARR
jgi:hypothetical protein